MAFGLKLRKTPNDMIDQRVRATAEILNISNLLNRKPKALSGGQRQRVALGRAMVRQPAVFLLDEPLSNLDAKLRASMRTELIKLHQRLGTTFVYVTHDQTEAMTMGDRIVVMKDGLIQQVDTPQNLYNHPQNAFVAGFIGSPQMNFFDAVFRKDTEGYYLEIQGDSVYLNVPRMNDNIRAYIDKPIKAGIRPENIKTDEDFLARHAKSVVEVTVEVCELMGNEALLYFNYNENHVTARISPNHIPASDTRIRVGFDTREFHLFDSETECAIYTPQGEKNLLPR
jgi:multiple sugar transport system ATP-binding protein